MKTTFVAAMFTVTGSFLLGAQPSARTTVGAIRWDAWTGGEITAQVERTLGPEKYHWRMPWFAEVGANGRVRIDGSPQAVMDQEIAFAARAGLDYWAFLLYPEKSSMSCSLQKYLTSTARRKIGFCVILHNSFAVPDQQWPRERDRAVALLREPGYQTVLDGRPLVYAFLSGGQGRFPAERFADFRKAAQTASQRPFYVFMGWNPASDFRWASTNGFDAVSAYACGSSDSTFNALSRRVEKQYWENAREAGVPYVPLVTTGWDKQPRKDNPVSWEKGDAYHQQSVFPAAATPAEIAAHLKQALRFVHENPRVCVANTVIVYAWNEHDEGGWLCPTWTPDGKPGTERITAIGKILNTNTQ